MVYTHPLPLCVIPVLLAAVPLLFGLAFARRRPRLLLGLLLTTLLLEGSLGSYFWNERLVISDRGLEQTSGWWFAAEVTRFRYVEISEVTIEAVQQSGDTSHHLWHFVLKTAMSNPTSTAGSANAPATHLTDTRRVTVDPNDVWDVNCGAVIAVLQEHGISVSFSQSPATLPQAIRSKPLPATESVEEIPTATPSSRS